MTRIWQNQNDVGDRRNRDYGYSLDTKQGFDDYGREPQACIIGDYAGRFLHPGHKSYWIKNNPESDRLLQKVVEELKKFSSVSVERDLGVISMIGENIARSPRVMRDIFEGLQRKKIKVRMVSLGATDINISLVIDADQIADAVKTLHGILV